ncbi:MAG: ATP synthase F0 subunit C [Planctomycetota bacterium]
MESAPFSALGVLGKGVGLGLAIMGAGRGIGAIGSHTVDAIARQPEAAGPIGQNGLILAALIEGATLFAIIAFSFLF